MHPGGRAHELTWRPDNPPSNTFHGRDIMAPAAAMLAAGEPLSRIARPMDNPVLLEIVPAEDRATSGRVIHVDHFGNATTNLRRPCVEKPAVSVRVNGKVLAKLKRTYWDVAPGKPLALIGSSGLLEIAVRDGSAERDLRVKVGDEVVLK